MPIRHFCGNEVRERHQNIETGRELENTQPCWEGKREASFTTMYVLVTYDVSTASAGGERRLRQVAKVCLDHGQRVQNSVFECKVDPAQLVFLRQKLLALIDPAHDSLRIYNLGANWHRRVEHHGAKAGYDVEGTLLV